MSLLLRLPRIPVASLLLALTAFAPLSAQESGAIEDPRHAELRALREELIRAIEAGDVEGQLKHVHENVVVTWQNGVVCSGVDELKSFMAETGSEAFLGYAKRPEATELTVFHGPDTGVVYGTSTPRYSLAGQELEVENHWTATIVREDGMWKLAGYHVSVNMLDNPLLNTARDLVIWTGLIFLAIGFAVGLFLGRLRKRS